MMATASYCGALAMMFGNSLESRDEGHHYSLPKLETETQWVTISASTGVSGYVQLWYSHSWHFILLTHIPAAKECVFANQFYFVAQIKMDASVYFLIKVFGLLILCIIILGICIKWYKKWKKWCKKRELERFKTFIRDQVISTFHQQRQGEDDDRFAVLMVANETSLGQLSKMRFERAKVSMLFFKDPLYDPSFPSYPVQKHLINYIVARADDTVHPESILLERFDELLVAYLHHHKKNANCVLLYSW